MAVSALAQEKWPNNISSNRSRDMEGVRKC